MKPVYFLFLIGLAATSCVDGIQRPIENKADEKEQSSEKPNVIFHKSHEPKKTDAPFSDIVQVGDLYFLSGQVGMDHSTRTLVEGGIEAETKQALENIKAVLDHHNLKMEQVVKATVILKDIDDFSAFNNIYKTYLPHKPARTTFAASGLAVGASIELEVVVAE